MGATDGVRASPRTGLWPGPADTAMAARAGTSRMWKSSSGPRTWVATSAWGTGSVAAGMVTWPGPKAAKSGESVWKVAKTAHPFGSRRISTRPLGSVTGSR